MALELMRKQPASLCAFMKPPVPEIDDAALSKATQLAIMGSVSGSMRLPFARGAGDDAMAVRFAIAAAEGRVLDEYLCIKLKPSRPGILVSCQQDFEQPTTYPLYPKTKPEKPRRFNKAFSCEYCDYTSSRKDNLIRHRRTHTGERPFVCDECGYATTHKGHLTQHLRKHSGEKPFGCKYCDYRAAKRWDITVHTRMHTGEKPFACTYCPYRAAYKCDLTSHIRIHTGEKPYECVICGYRATQKAHLIRHERKHTGEKPYHCTLCEYRCSNKSDLAKHTSAHQRGTTRGNEVTRRSKRKSYQPLPPADAQRADPTNVSLPTVERDVAKAEPASGGEEQTRQPTDDVTSMALDFKSPSASEGPVEPTENFKHDTQVTEVTRTEETILSV